MLWKRRTQIHRGSEPVILRHRTLELWTKSQRAALDGKTVPCKVGNWMFYIPDTGEKLFQAREGRTDCIHPSRPSDDELTAGLAREASYSLEEWRFALNQPLEERLAELWVASDRLARAGLGPQPLGLSFVEAFSRDGLSLGPTMGFVSENVDLKSKKQDCTDEDMLRAGVQPDKSRSSVRQQRRGYVIDLCSVVGVKPIDAEEEVANALDWIRTSRSEV